MESKTSSLDLLSREVANITSRNSIDNDMSIAELGIDSLSIVELMVFCEQLYGSFDPTKLAISEFTTLRDLDAQMSESNARADA